ncbi:MAG TPA: bifunctional phosphoglucose/phosphomannose isomerase [Candidatus Limnocylindrales bacterium]|nr:bifunctional phosphoglucose/phosphomannose isomerase [Candidatus Limnocylindrales bacterium]
MSGVLDDGQAMARLDAGGMLAAVAGLPAQLRDAWALTRELGLGDAHRAATAAAVAAMGGSAIGADVVRGVFDDRLRVPLVTVRDYDLPAWVGPSSLVVAASYSGATEETIAAFTAAVRRRCPVAVIATGGPLADVAEQAGLPLLRFPGGGQPRAAVGWSAVLLAGLLERAGVLDLGEADVSAAAQAVDVVLRACGPGVATDHNPAKQIAWSIVDRVPLVEAAGFLAPVARRWKTQLNENGKSHAIWEELPEATHNAVVGYGRPETINDRLYVLFLSSPLDHARNRLRATLSMEALTMAGIEHQLVPVAGEGRLAQAFAAIALGDLVSVYLGFLYGLDPTPIEPIARIKERLLTEDGADPR